MSKRDYYRNLIKDVKEKQPTKAELVTIEYALNFTYNDIEVDLILGLVSDDEKIELPKTLVSINKALEKVRKM